MYNFRSGAIRWQITDFVSELDLHQSIANINLHKSHKGHFCTSSYHLSDSNILNFDLENWGQGHVVEKRDLRHLIANINQY